MKKLCYYIQFEFKHLYKKAALLSLIMCITQNFVLAIKISSEQIEQYIRFEKLIYNSPYIFIFYLMFIGFFVVIVVTQAENYFGTKSIYSLLTVPVSRKIIYFSKIIGGLLSILIIYSAQIINIFISYSLYKIMLPVENQITNGLGLAMLRSPFLASLIPVNPLFIVWNIITLAYIVIAIVYAVTALNNESRRPFLNIFVILASVFLAWTVFILNSTLGISSFLIPMSMSELSHMTLKDVQNIVQFIFVAIEIIFIGIVLIVGGIKIYEKTNI